jgi:predicted amidohydrolase YtcJ
VPVSRAADIPGLVGLIRERAALTPAGQWIRSAADWHELGLAERRLPTAAELDEATTDHPVLLQRGGHNGVLNSAGLRLAGIGRGTPDAEGGFIDRDAAGQPRGWVQDAALELAQRVLPPLPEDALISGLAQASAGYAALGLGTVRDAAVMPAQWHAYLRAQAAGQLSVRCHAMMMTTPAAIAAAGSVDAYLDSLEAQGIKPGAGLDLLRVWGL